MHTTLPRLASITVALVIAAGTARADDGYVQTNLVSNGAVPALQTDSALQDPWGIALSTTSPFWISDQASSVASLISVSATTGKPAVISLAPTVPNLTNAPPPLLP